VSGGGRLKYGTAWEEGFMVRHFVVAHLGLLYELSGVLIVFVLIISLSGILIARLDGVPLGEAIYFAFITAFTVGYGDIAPKSRGARLVTVFLSFVGVVLVGILVAVAVHALDLALHPR
jgi:voltage-gated potassium channel